ncbi:glycosyltransferase [Leptolyngbya sp. FACHB-261]|uniref:glycosyltransferase n=1 Tax=Leptolyngbya sp. FACHB-261 TaxID=2692806 RepID=UPI0016850C94|nr:glycosyltransferase [Leptolyngbya sp. FACHB-261]MBD2099617.1 glycosyltransferase [Leptolyngbya sp. FACHB-261]
MTQNKIPPQIHLWVPDLFEGGKGGIRVYSTFLIQALQKLRPHCKYDIFLKHDAAQPSNLPFLEQTQFHFSGQWPLRFRTPAFAFQLASYGLWQRPSLILSTHLNFTVVAYWLKQLTGTPYWAVAHGVDAWDIQKPALRRGLQGADRILAVSDYTRTRLLQEQDLDPERVVLLPNTFDSDRFQIKSKPEALLKRYCLQAEQPVILTVARLDATERYKGYDQILQALPEIRQQIPDVHYLLVGQGSDRPRIEQLVDQLQLQDCVTLTGFVPDQELGDHYNLCDVFAMPSKSEGFGIVYLEALACGKPTLGGNQDGATDALCQGDLGVLVDPDDVPALAQTLTTVLQGTYPNPRIYQPEWLRQQVIERFGWQQFQKTLAELLQNLG